MSAPPRCRARPPTSRPTSRPSTANGSMSARPRTCGSIELVAVKERHVPVLIVGGGPVGLALAGDLGWRGVRCLLIEQSDGSIYQPRMDLVGVRTMEFCRRWGLVPAVEASRYPRDYPQDN